MPPANVNGHVPIPNNHHLPHQERLYVVEFVLVVIFVHRRHRRPRLSSWGCLPVVGPLTSFVVLLHWCDTLPIVRFHFSRVLTNERLLVGFLL
jgi:hypothetical protein